MNKLKVRFMLVVVKFILQMYINSRVNFSNLGERSQECLILIEDLEKELKTV